LGAFYFTEVGVDMYFTNKKLKPFEAMMKEKFINFGKCHRENCYKHKSCKDCPDYIYEKTGVVKHVIK
jgi:hypothetical protein